MPEGGGGGDPVRGINTMVLVGTDCLTRGGHRHERGVTRVDHFPRRLLENQKGGEAENPAQHPSIPRVQKAIDL